jgi:hypothetical protein
MGKRFDDLSKAFASGVSRRQALMGALGGVGAAVAAAVIPGRGSALADSDAAHRCANFCATYCQHQAIPVNGNLTYIKYCTEQCIAEASMGQGVCFGISGAPLFKLGCHHTGPGQCPSGQICCNNRCCKAELCFSLFQSFYSRPPFINVNGGGLPPPFTNGLEPPYFFDEDRAEICLGCPQSV